MSNYKLNAWGSLDVKNISLEDFNPPDYFSLEIEFDICHISDENSISTYSFTLSNIKNIDKNSLNTKKLELVNKYSYKLLLEFFETQIILPAQKMSDTEFIQYLNENFEELN